jgi:pimeloyl-ACP methyl ester carboxylesterase
VLRFDYYGCGDSAGDPLEASLAQWLSDIETAVKELKSRQDLSKIGLVGARIGATLSILGGARRSELDAVVLWDPIIKGAYYLETLNAQHQEWLNENPMRKSTVHPDTRLEVLGFPINRGLAQSLEQVDLLNVQRCPARHVLTLETEKTNDGEALRDHLRSRGAVSEYQLITVPPVWLRRRGADNVVVPLQALQAIAAWLSRIT